MSDYLYGIHSAREGLKDGGLRQPLELIVGDGKNPRLQEVIDEARQRHVVVRFCDRARLEKLCGHGHHQGVLLKVAPFDFAPFGRLLEDWHQSQRSAFFLLLDGITDPHNLGAILRSADAAGCHGVIVPRDRSCPVTPVVDRTAAGALAHLPICQVTNLSRAIDDLKREGVWVYGLAGEEGAGGIYGEVLDGDVALVVGSEGNGLRSGVKKHCDRLLAIPMAGGVSSLNASVAAGVALFEVVRQQQKL